MPDLTLRRRQPEIMDQPDLDPKAHVQALRGLARINLWSGSAGILWRELATLVRETSTRSLRILDVATGGGDVPIRLWRRARRAGLDFTIEGCDVSTCAIEHADTRARESTAAVRFFPLDVLGEDIPGEYDVVTSSLFLHHLEDNQAIELLRRMGKAARHLVLVNDLVRSGGGYWLAYVGTRLLSASWVAHTAGPRSVEGAYTPSEALALAERAGLRGTTVARRWPFRFLLKWRR